MRIIQYIVDQHTSEENKMLTGRTPPFQAKIPMVGYDNDPFLIFSLLVTQNLFLITKFII